MSLFKKAERRQAKLKIALTAPSGGGKTFSALLLAQGIGKKIAVIDTENGSASLYADRFEFDTVEIEAPYTVPKYINAIKAAQDAGYDVVIVDSLSHAWAADGGLLSKKEALDARGGNSYTNWAGITKEHEQLKAAILNADIHMVVTMRSKQDYVMEVNEKGKSAPRKVGLAPIQRDGMEYEFTTVFDIAMDHNAAVSKDRTGLFDGQIFKLSKDTGELIMKWLLEGKAIEPKPAPVAPTPLPTRPSPLAPSAVPAAAEAPPKVTCKACNVPLSYSSNSKGYYCPNFKNKEVQHTYLKDQAAYDSALAELLDEPYFSEEAQA